MNKLSELVGKYGKEKVMKSLKNKMSRKATVNYELKAKVGKNGFWKPEFYADATIATIYSDSVGQSFHPEYLKQIASSGIEINGLFREDHFSNDTPDFIARELRYEEGELKARLYLIPESPKYKDLLSGLRSQTTKGLSLGLEEALVSDDDKFIVGGRITEVLLTRNPMDRNTKIRG